jgi:hypothetical protein
MGKIIYQGSSLEEGGQAIANSLLQEEARMKKASNTQKTSKSVRSGKDQSFKVIREKFNDDTYSVDDAIDKLIKTFGLKYSEAFKIVDEWEAGSESRLPSRVSSAISSSYSSVNELAQAFLSGSVYLQRDVETALEQLGEDPKQAFNLMRQWKEFPESVGANVKRERIDKPIEDGE